MSSVLIRRSVIRGDARTYHDLELDTSKVTIGADADNTIQLSGEGLERWHAAIVVARNGTAQLRGIGKHKVSINGELLRRSAISAGDEITLGENIIRVLPPPPGFTLALQFDSDQSGQQENLRPVIAPIYYRLILANGSPRGFWGY